MADNNNKKQEENYICVDGEKHYFVPNHPSQDLCKSKCSLMNICFENMMCDTQLCKIFDKEGNGNYELKN